MDVLNLSLGEPEVGPGDDLVETAIAGAARAGVTTVVAAGDGSDQGGFGTVSSPGSAADAITVAAVTNDRIFGLPLTVVGRAGPPFAVVAGPIAIPDSWGAGLPLRVSTGCGTGDVAGALLLVALGPGCKPGAVLRAAKPAGIAGLVLVTTAQGDPSATDADPVVDGGVPAVVISRRMGADLAALVSQAGGTLTVTVGNVVESLGSGNGGLTTTFSSKGPAPISLRLKPDVAAPGEGVLSAIPGGYAIWDGTSMASPAVAGAVALLLQRHPTWSPDDLRSALALTAKPAYANPARTIEALPLEVGSGLIDVTAADTTPLLSPDASADFGLVEAPSDHTETVELRNAGSGAGSWTVTAPRPDGPRDARRPGLGRRAADACARRARRRSRRQPAGLRVAAAGRPLGADPLVGLRPASAAAGVARAGGVARHGVGQHPAGDAARLALRLPRSPDPLGLPASYPGREQVLWFRCRRTPATRACA